MAYAIAASGGGANTVFGAGFFTGLFMKRDSIKFPSHVVASSGSAGASVYAAAGQVDHIKSAWLDHVPSIWSLRRFPFLDIDALGRIYRELFPIDTNRFFDSDVSTHIGATNAKTGLVEYFGNRTPGIDVYALLCASAAVPLVYGRRVRIGTEDFLDTFASSSLVRNVHQATVQHDVNGVVAIDVENRSESGVSGRLYGWWLDRQSQEFKDGYCKERSLNNFPDLPIYVVHPPEPLGMLEFNPVKMGRSYEAGFRAAQDPRLEDFINRL